MITVSFKVNGRSVTLETEPADRLIDLLRERLGLTGTKEGCSQGECGACTVIMKGNAVCSCMIPACQLEGTEVITIEGTSPMLQEAFVKAGAVQCGFCTPGMIMSVYALLMKNPHPSDGEIEHAIEGNLCRCTGYRKIIDAVHLAEEAADD